jgi:hypothetical protein
MLDEGNKRDERRGVWQARQWKPELMDFIAKVFDLRSGTVFTGGARAVI